VTNDLSISAQARYAHLRSLLADDFPPPADIVEFGAAPGDQIATLAAAGYRATAIDIGIASDEWANGDNGRMQRLFAESAVELVTWNLEDSPYPLQDESFDAVLMTEVYEHLRDYPIRALREAQRVLRPGGRLYFTTPNAAYLVNRMQLLRGRSVATPLPDWIGGLPHARHAREYTFSEVRELMATAGLRVVHAESRHFHLGTGTAAKRAAKAGIDLLARMRPTLGPMIVVVAQR
jgi:SAM-dependent methyltransferase